MSASRLSAWLPVLAWAAVIFALSSIPHLGTGLGTWDTVLRKGAHVTEYAIFGLLLMRAIGREAPAFLLGVAYAITDEVHQHFVSGPAAPENVAQYQSTVSPSLTVTWSAPTGGTIPLTLKIQPLVPPAG